MAYLGSWKIDDNLTFPANTHTASTGAGTDADSVPTYRVYEDETGTAILTGSMAKLDDANTVGFYSEQVALSAANGLEKGKCYTVYISATVGGVTGTMSHTFQIEAEVDANVVSDKSGYGLATGAITAAVIATDAIDADAIADNAINAAAIAADAITAAKIADGAIDAATFAAGAINAAAIATDAITAAKVAADAVTEIQSGLATSAALATVDTNVDTLVASITTTDALVDAVLDEVLSGHSTAGSLAKIVNDNLNATVGSRATQTSVDTIDDFLDTEIAAIKAVTDALTSAGAGKLATSSSTMVTGTAITGTLSTTQFTTDLAEATDDHYNGRTVIFTSGVLLGQARTIADYAGSNKLITVAALTDTPTNGMTFVIV